MDEEFLAEIDRLRAELKDLLILGKDFSHGMTSKQFEDHCRDKLKKIEEALK